MEFQKMTPERATVYGWRNDSGLVSASLGRTVLDDEIMRAPLMKLAHTVETAGQAAARKANQLQPAAFAERAPNLVVPPIASDLSPALNAVRAARLRNRESEANLDAVPAGNPGLRSELRAVMRQAGQAGAFERIMRSDIQWAEAAMEGGRETVGIVDDALWSRVVEHYRTLNFIRTSNLARSIAPRVTVGSLTAIDPDPADVQRAARDAMAHLAGSKTAVDDAEMFLQGVVRLVGHMVGLNEEQALSALTK